MPSSAFFLLFVNVLLLLTFPLFSVAITKHKTLFLSSTLKSPKGEAEKLNRDLNCPTVHELARHSGYYRLPHSHDARMFYYFFESRQNRTDPVVIWLTGGPGCASELALFYENGPFHLTNNVSLVWNAFGWDKVSNLIYVDQPTGTGFSYSSNINDIRLDQASVSNDLYDFLQVFFKERPQYANNDFYIAGESYGGHFIPALATRIQQGNKNKEGIPINLKGMAIGNGLTNSEIQFKAYTDYALDMNLIKESDHNNMSQLVSQCDQAMKLCGTGGAKSCTAAYDVCISIFLNIVQMNDGINPQDIRKKCEGRLCYDLSNLKNFLNQRSVRDALGVGEREFVFRSPTVYEAMIPDLMRKLDVGIPALIEDGIKLLVYAGEYDLTCNWLGEVHSAVISILKDVPSVPFILTHPKMFATGNWRWVEAMEWSGQKDFRAAPTVAFTVDGAEAGLKKSHGPLIFLKMHDAGQLVPTDQPKASLEMLKRWMQGSL